MLAARSGSVKALHMEQARRSPSGWHRLSLARRVACTVLLAALLPASHAEHIVFWRQPAETLNVQRIDPIVMPGTAPSGHAHIFVGSSSVSPNTSTAALRSGLCTSSSTAEDYSAYWFPQLYFHFANDTFASVHGGITQYYLPGDTDTVTTLPDDFRMLANSPERTTFDESLSEHRALEANCLGGGGKTYDWPKGNCPNGLRVEIQFPSCWNGVDTDSPDHHAHTAYPISKPDGTDCPAGMKRIVRIFVEAMFDVDSWEPLRSQAKTPTTPFVWANGNTEFYGFHGDFYFGWKEGALEKAFKECNNDAAGTLEANCPGGILNLNPEASQKCHKTADVDEQVLGALPNLPGCPILYDATTGPRGLQPDCKMPQLMTPSTQYMGDAPPAGSCTLSGGASVLDEVDGYGYQGCLVYDGDRPLAESPESKESTVESCIAACQAAGLDVCGLEYGGECRGDKALNVQASDINSCNMPCKDDPAHVCGGAKSITLYQRDKAAAQTTTCTRSDSVDWSSTDSTPGPSGGQGNDKGEPLVLGGGGGNRPGDTLLDAAPSLRSLEISISFLSLFAMYALL